MNESEVLRQPLWKTAKSIESRDLSPVEVVGASLASTERHNGTLNAFRLVLAEESMAAARQAEAEIMSGAYRGSLHGIPVAVKDLMDMEGTTTPAGSIVFADEVASEDSEVVRLLKEAGAVIVGKTHMPEFAYAPSSHNEHYGPVRNPWNLDHDTGGSSSGSGSAVAAGLVYGATGSDTGGSIRIPSALCGLAGIKPTFGRVSARGAMPLSWSLDHIGPMTRTVRDAALMLDAIAGYDARDPRTQRVLAGGYADDLDAGAAGLRIAMVVDDGVDGNYWTDAVLVGVRAGIDALRGSGAVITDLALPLLRDLAYVTIFILNVEAAAQYEHLLRDRADDIGRWTHGRMIGSYIYSPTDYVKVQQLRSVLRRRFEQFFEDYDLLALPGVLHEAPVLGQALWNNRLTSPFNCLGWPAICVPVGLGEHDLPVSLQLVARPWQEQLLFRAARVVETLGPWCDRLSPLLAQA